MTAAVKVVVKVAVGSAVVDLDLEVVDLEAAGSAAAGSAAEGSAAGSAAEGSAAEGSAAAREAAKVIFRPLSDGPTHACSPHARPIATSARLKARLRRRYPRSRTCDTRDTCANTTSGRLGSHGHAQTHATSSACRGWVAGGSLCADAGSRESARYTWMIERWRDGLERTVASDTPGARAARWRPQG